jgi:predicted component of type VI protein secretion system
MLFGDSYYLTVGISDTTTAFEKEGVPYLRPHYEYALLSLEEAEAQDVMPLVHFNVKDGMFSIDTAYIPPCLLMTCNQQFATYVEKYVGRLSTITSHQNLEEGDGKRALLHYLFIMKGYSLRNSVHDFLMLLQEIAHAIDYYIISPNTEQSITIPEPRQVDVQL